MIGSTISHYEITAELGRGGMGVVYRARDTRLDRDVAIKVLATHLKGDDKARMRFEQEARAASALNHDHIGVVHEIGETDDGQLYMAIAFYEGQTLEDILARGALIETDAVRFAAQAASALAAAHAAGIIHRDIKPANLMIPAGGSLKVLDFGLAKLAGSADLSTTGSTMGTMAYMSPEQTSGMEVGAASDIWSLGVVLYEMLAGRRPFDESYPSAVVYSIVNQEPPPLVDVEEQLADLVTSCLAKDASDRPSAAELHYALSTVGQSYERSQAPHATRPKTKIAWMAGVLLLILSLGYALLGNHDDSSATHFVGIAVIPCQDNSPNRENDWLGDGLANDISLQLASYPQLRVPESGASSYFKNNPADAQSIGDQLGVDYVLRCTVLRDNDDFRITVELADTESGARVWGESIDETFDRAIALRDRIRDRIIENLEPIIGRQTARPVQAVDPLAYEYYLKGLYANDAFDMEKAIRFLDLSLDVDSTFADAHRSKAGVLQRLLVTGAIPLQPATSAVIYHGQKATEYAPNDYLNWSRLSYNSGILLLDWDAAFAYREKAIELGYPGYISWVPASGNISADITVLTQYFKQNATSLSAAWYMSHLIMRLGRPDEAEMILDNIDGLYPGSPLIYMRRAELHLMREEFQSAYTLFDELVRQSPKPDPLLRFFLGIAAGSTGRMDVVEEILDELTALDASSPRFQFARAILQGFLGNVDEAMTLLQETVERKSLWASSIGLYTHLPSLRNDPRFPDLIRQALPNDAWLYARFNSGGMLLNPDEVERQAKLHEDA